MLHGFLFLQICVIPGLSIFANFSKPNATQLTFPEPASSLFRTFSVIKPDFLVVMRTHLAAQGFKSYKMLGDKLKNIDDICNNQLYVY